MLIIMNLDHINLYMNIDIFMSYCSIHVHKKQIDLFNKYDKISRLRKKKCQLSRNKVGNRICTPTLWLTQIITSLVIFPLNLLYTIEPECGGTDPISNCVIYQNVHVDPLSEQHKSK